MIYGSLPGGKRLAAHGELGIWWGSIGFHGYADSLEKMQFMNEKLLFFRMVSSNTPCGNLGYLGLGCWHVI